MPAGFLSLPALALTALLGVVAGVGGYTFFYARGPSYVGNDPATCGNCHAMQSHYEGWRRGPHHAAATCNDCHVPSSALAKYGVKALNGWHHTTAFTTGDYPDVVQIRDSSRAVVERQCRFCHADLVDAMESTGEVSCIHCHDSVGHLR